MLEWDDPFAKWFVGGKTNISYNCIDRHLASARKNKVAILWEGEPGDVRALSYQMLHREVCRFANVLKSLGLQKGDRATIYMGMVPELAIAMLACARMGVTTTSSSAASAPRRFAIASTIRNPKCCHHCRRRLPPRRGCATQKECR